MILRTCTTIGCALALLSVSAQDIKADLTGIPATVTKNADIIRRSENVELSIEKSSHAKLKIHRIQTVLNEDGMQALVFTQYTNKFISLDDAEIRVYDQNGKQLSKHKKKDLVMTAIGEGLVDDGHMYLDVFKPASYPVTVEYEYEIGLDGTLMIPDYQICLESEGVVSSVFTARISGETGFRYRPRNISTEPVVTTDGGTTVYTWTLKNLPPVLYEPGAVSISDRLPAVNFAVNKFSLYGQSGDLSSWKTFGEWINSLYTGLDELTPERKAFFNDLVKQCKDDRSKASLIYQYLQQNFRYVSIQLGIGGLKPFSAAFTDSKKYGDCKALSNYMKAALKSVGIRSELGIINAGYNEEPVDPAFPCNGFNHVILCIPGAKDSIWLECTSNQTAFGVLGSFTENRYALLLSDEGGHLVPTPRSSATSNTMNSRTEISLSDDGSGETSTVFRSTGAYSIFMEELSHEKRDEQKVTIVSGLGYKQPDDFAFNPVSNTSPRNDSLLMVIEKVPEFVAGGKLFLPQRIYHIWPEKLPKAESRNQDFFFKYPFRKQDTTTYILPAGFIPDVIPAPKKLSCAFGTYETNYWVDQNKKVINAAVVLTLNQMRIPAARYAEVKKFFDDIMTDESQKIVIRKE